MSDPVASVVIPAHNEGRVIHRCLAALAASGLADRLEIVVAANGCTDDTVAVARGFAGVRVLDLAEPSKVAALNAGDAAVSALPRIYLDADVELSPDAVASLVELLTTDAPRVAAPAVSYVTDGAAWPVRAFYRMFELLPSSAEGIAGHGVYAVSGAGRARFGRFPEMQGDDLFVDRLFSPDERLRARGHSRVRTPQTLESLLKVRTRVTQGNAQLAANTAELPDGDFGRTTGGTLAAALRLVRRRPALLPDLAVFVAISFAARLRARRADATTWQRDHSTR